MNTFKNLPEATQQSLLARLAGGEDRKTVVLAAVAAGAEMGIQNWEVMIHFPAAPIQPTASGQDHMVREGMRQQARQHKNTAAWREYNHEE
jgi:hypothetical protein